MRHDLARALLEPLGRPDLQVHELVRLSGGASRETWSVLVGGDGWSERLILRRDPPGHPRPGGMVMEANALRAAQRAGVPVPNIRAVGEDLGGQATAYMVVDYVPGETIPRKILRDEEFDGIRPQLAFECGRHLAAIHSIERAEIPGLDEPDQLEECASALTAMEEPHPALEVAVRWLRANRPPGRPGLVHGDYRNGNLIVGPEGIRAVLDWEVVHWGDRVEDLGFLCVKAWRFGQEPPVGGFGGYKDLLAGYRAGGGQDVAVEEIRWWEVLGTLRWALSCIRMGRRHLDGLVRSVELAAIGRRAAEQEWDILEELAELVSLRSAGLAR